MLKEFSGQVTQLLASIDKCVSSLTETSNMSGIKVVLEPAPINDDPISRRLETATPQYIAECERLIISWAATIESFIMEAFEERYLYYCIPHTVVRHKYSAVAHSLFLSN